MRFSRSEPGFLLSAAVHAGLLAFLLVHFSQEPKFEDAQEAVPVETITESQFHEIMKGEKEAKPAPKPRVDKVADVSETKPTPPTPEAKRDIPTPPPPLKRLPDPGEADEAQPSPPTPPERPAPTPPPPPPPPVKPAPPQETKQEPDKDDAEVVKPKPPPKPPEKPPEKAEQKPAPPKPPEKPAPNPTPKAADKPTPAPPKLDEVAKLLKEAKDKEPAKPVDKPAAKPKSGDESAPPHRSTDRAELDKLLSKEAPEAKFAAGRELSRTAALGAPNATGAKMSPSLSDALNGLLQDQYKQCWSYLPLTGGQRYVAKVRVSFLPDGSLAAQPVLLNPPSDPALRGLAESAMRAVRRCNPMRIPPQFRPYYDQWKDWVVGFDPEILN